MHKTNEQLCVIKCNRNKMVLTGICLLLVIAVCVYFVLEGFNHIDPKLALWHAQRSWREGQIVQAIPQFVRAVWMAFEAGGRWSIADTHVNKMRLLEEEGRLHEALRECATAVRILHGYDDEGGLSYECYVIEQRIERLSLPQTPTPSPEP